MSLKTVEGTAVTSGPSRDDTDSDRRPTYEEVAALITRAGELLDDLRSAFADLKYALREAPR